MAMTSNRALQDGPTIFPHDRTLTSAILDRLLHHAETVIIAGKSFRMKDQLAHCASLHPARRKRTFSMPATR